MGGGETEWTLTSQGQWDSWRGCLLLTHLRHSGCKKFWVWGCLSPQGAGLGLVPVWWETESPWSEWWEAICSWEWESSQCLGASVAWRGEGSGDRRPILLPITAWQTQAAWEPPALPKGVAFGCSVKPLLYLTKPLLALQSRPRTSILVPLQVGPSHPGPPRLGWKLWEWALCPSISDALTGPREHLEFHGCLSADWVTVYRRH